MSPRRCLQKPFDRAMWRSTAVSPNSRQQKKQHLDSQPVIFALSLVLLLTQYTHATYRQLWLHHISQAIEKLPKNPEQNKNNNTNTFRSFFTLSLLLDFGLHVRVTSLQFSRRTTKHQQVVWQALFDCNNKKKHVLFFLRLLRFVVTGDYIANIHLTTCRGERALFILPSPKFENQVVNQTQLLETKRVVPNGNDVLSSFFLC